MGCSNSSLSDQISYDIKPRKKIKKNITSPSINELSISKTQSFSTDQTDKERIAQDDKKQGQNELMEDEFLNLNQTFFEKIQKDLKGFDPESFSILYQGSSSLIIKATKCGIPFAIKICKNYDVDSTEYQYSLKLPIEELYNIILSENTESLVKEQIIAMMANSIKINDNFEYSKGFVTESICKVIDFCLEEGSLKTKICSLYLIATILFEQANLELFCSFLYSSTFDNFIDFLENVDNESTILIGIQEKSERVHGFKIQDSAVVAAATLSNRYIADRFLPDKAIDLIDEACAMIRSEVESMPTELDVISRKIMQYEIEEKSLDREDNPKFQKRLVELRKELASMREQFQDMKLKWENEKKNISKIQKLKEKIDDVNSEIEKAERNYDLNKAAELKYSTLPNLKTVLEQEEKEIEKTQGANTLLKNKVTEEEIAKVVSKWTGIPVSKLAEAEKQKLLSLEAILHERVVGQDEAVKKVSEAILRARAGIANPNRPIGSFMFLGPTGVGKTELAKTLAATLFDDEKNMIRLDMSEYMEKFSVTRLIGAPPGYVGYEEGGQLTEAVRRKPYSVVLFDEVEKAHPDVFNILLQVLDDGRVTDSQGRLIDFKNTVIILTSNLGSQVILKSISENKEITEKARENIDMILKQHFRPEFLNRLDEIICFKALEKDVVFGIVELILKGLINRVKDNGVELSFTKNSVRWLVEEGYDMEFGARPLKRIVQSQVETLMARKLISGEIKDGDKVEVYYDKRIHGLNVRPKKEVQAETIKKDIS